MPHGRISRIEPDLGFGWIEDDAGMDWFFVSEGVHESMRERMRVDERVKFVHEWTPSGPRASAIVSEHPQQAE